MPPSLLVHSGGGLQAWWLFKEPWALEHAEEVAKAGALSARWIRALRARAAARGWDLDSVGDLPRVMRVPGTANCKIAGTPRPVRLLEINDRRYNPSDMEEYLDLIGAERVSTTAPKQSASTDLVYSTDANPPFDLFQVLCDAEQKFKNAWDHKRKDMQDQSASAYDMALADYAVQACWTDQHIADLLIAHRRRWNEDPKLRDSYYAKTIAKAREKFTAGDLMREIDYLVTPDPENNRDEDGEKKPAPAPEDPLQKKSQLVDRLSQVFKVKIIRVLKYVSDPPEYALETEHGTIRLGEVSNLIEPRPLRLKIAAVASKLIPMFKQNAQWEKIAAALLEACVEVPVGAEGTNAGLVNSWLAAYLDAKPVLDSVEEADGSKSPFLRDSHVHVYLADFRRWVHINTGDRVPPKELGILLRRSGAEPSMIHVAGSTRQVWCLAADPGRAPVAPAQPQEPDHQEVPYAVN